MMRNQVFFYVETPSGTRGFNTYGVPTQAKMLQRALELCKGLPDMSKIWWGDCKREADAPFVGFMIEVIHGSYIGLYRINYDSGFETRQQIKAGELKRHFKR